MVAENRIRTYGRIAVVALVLAVVGTVGQSVQEVSALSFGKCYDRVCQADDGPCKEIDCDYCHIDHRCALEAQE